MGLTCRGQTISFRARFLLLSAIAVLSIMQASAAFGYEFGPLVKQIGPEQTVFDWSTDRCELIDVPDEPARAFRDSLGQVHLIASHYVTRADVGSTLDTVRHSCSVLMGSDQDPDPSHFDDRRWLTATYTPDGRTVAALVHEEYQGNTHPGQCPTGEYRKCWYNAITFAVSTNGGKSFSQSWPPGLVAASPYKYIPDAGPYGIFQPSNIVYKDGFYYAIVRAEPFQAQSYGSCLVRTSKLMYPASWRGWNGTDFWVRFVNPYTDTTDPAAAHVCKPLDFQGLAPMTESLTYNSYFNKYMLVGASSRPDPVTGEQVPAVYFTLSSDLIHWGTRRGIMKAEFPWTVTQCEDLNPINYPSILVGGSSRNFDVVGRRAYLYFTRDHWSSWHGNCSETLDRDLVRIPIEFGATSP
jgi:hypothetical protein